MNPKPIILDISEWQVPSQIHYDVLSRQIGGVIVRIQYGSNYEDKHYRTHLAAFQKYNVPVAVYAWVRLLRTWKKKQVISIVVRKHFSQAFGG